MLHHQKITNINSKGLYPAKLHYNCAIFQANNTTYLLYRCQNKLTENSWLAVSELGKDLQPINYKKLEIPVAAAEDPRVVVKRDEIYVFFNTGSPEYPKVAPTDYTINVAVFDLAFQMKDLKPLTYVNRRSVEKNWQVFYDPERAQWACIYNVNPWQVMLFDANWTGTIAYEADYKLPWHWGEIRGGAAPIRFEPLAGVFSRARLFSQYYAWFHSSHQHPVKALGLKRQYVGGLLTFDAQFPYLPTGISRYPILAPDKRDRTVVQANVVFPAGAIYEEKRWLVSYGSGDCQCKVVELQHDELVCGLNYEGNLQLKPQEINTNITFSG